jgi:hypothetical protein
MLRTETQTRVSRHRSKDVEASDDGVQHLEPLGFWTSLIVLNPEWLENTLCRELDLFPSTDGGGRHLFWLVP